MDSIGWVSQAKLKNVMHAAGRQRAGVKAIHVRGPQSINRHLLNAIIKWWPPFWLSWAQGA